MVEINFSKCPSCGAANMEELGENRVNCVQCGANLSLVVKKGSGLKRILISALFVVLLASGAFYYVSNETQEAIQELTKPAEVPVTPNIAIKKSLDAVPKLKKNAMTITSEQFKQAQDRQTIARLQVVNSVNRKNKNGGQFWIVTIENQTNKSIARPRVVLKLLNNKNEQIESYSAWSKLETLPAGKSTSVLIDIPKVPKEEFHSEMSAQSSPASLYDKAQQILDIQDFNVSILDETKMQFELTGTVTNPFDYQVDFVEIIALAKDKQGNTVGYAKAYASTTNIKPKQTSPFTVKAKKYVTQTPYSWTLSAMARKH